MSIGHKGMVYASKALAMTMADLYKFPSQIKDVKNDFLENRKYEKYDPRILPGPPSLD